MQKLLIRVQKFVHRACNAYLQQLTRMAESLDWGWVFFKDDTSSEFSRLFISIRKTCFGNVQQWYENAVRNSIVSRSGKENGTKDLWVPRVLMLLNMSTQKGNERAYLAFIYFMECMEARKERVKHWVNVHTMVHW